MRIGISSKRSAQKVTLIAPAQRTLRDTVSPSFAASVSSEIDTVIVRKIIARKLESTSVKAGRVAIKAVDKVLDGYFKMLTRYMGVGGDLRINSDLGVIWRPLDRRYQIRKMKEHRGRTFEDFWLYSGQLQSQFQRKRGLTAFGGTVFTVTPTGPQKETKTPMAEINLQYAPKILGMAALVSNQVTWLEFSRLLEEGGGITEKQYRKLAGRATYHRALLGPVMKRLVDKTIPLAVSAALAKAGIKNTFKNRATRSLGKQFEGA